MNDCPNAGVRDLLPDLLHARLDAESRALVEAHVAQCTDCAAELEFLRQFQASRRTPRIDIAAIATAVLPYRAPARGSWIGWRAAAAIAVMVAGASSVALLNRGRPASTAGTTRPVAAVAARPVAHDSLITADVSKTRSSLPSQSATEDPSTMSRTAPAPNAIAVPAAERELAMAGGALGDLNDRELASLLRDIVSLDAVPSVDVEATPVSPIAPSGPARR